MLQSYRASGRCGSAFYVATIGLLVFAAVTGWVYQRAVHVVPFIYVNVLLTLGFGWVLTVALSKAQALGRCRNAAAAMLAGVVVGVVAVGASHFAAWRLWQGEVADAVAKESGLELQREGVRAEDRREIGEQVRAEVRAAAGFPQYVQDRFTGGWTLGRGGGLEITGVFVALVWLVEAGILVAAGVRGAAALKGDAYCERCDRWADAVRGRILTGNPKRTDVAALRVADAADALFPKGDTRFAEARSHLVHLWKECAGCGQGFLDLFLLTYVPGDKGEVKTETETLRANLLVDDDVRRAFEAAAAAAAAAEQAALTPPEPTASEPI